jgi:hypothetical protein
MASADAFAAPPSRTSSPFTSQIAADTLGDIKTELALLRILGRNVAEVRNFSIKIT